MLRGRRFLELRVISVWVVKDSNCEEFFSDNAESCVMNKEYRSKDRSLWNTELMRCRSWFTGLAMDNDKLSAVCKVLEQFAIDNDKLSAVCKVLEQFLLYSSSSTWYRMCSAHDQFQELGCTLMMTTIQFRNFKPPSFLVFFCSLHLLEIDAPSFLNIHFHRSQASL